MTATTFLGIQPDHKKFAQWAKKRGIFLNPDVAFLVPTKRMGLGVYALKPLKKGSTIISCPLSSAISPYETAVVESPSAAAIAAAMPAQPPHGGESSAAAIVDNTLKVCLRLMAELCRPQSCMRPWLECCPRMPAHLFGLPQRLMARMGLESSSPAMRWSNVGQQLTEVNADGLWERAQQVMERNTAVWPPQLCTQDLFVECLTQVLSRNFHREEVRGQEGPYLLPGVDFVNHSFTHTNASFTMHGGGRARSLSFDVMALRDIAKGEQVYYNYGPISEARFFVEFQFLNEAEGNPHDQLRFSFDTLTTLAQATLEAGVPSGGPTIDVASRMHALQRQALWNDEGIFVEPRLAANLAEGENGNSAAASGTTAASSQTFLGVSGDLWNAVYLLTCINDEVFEGLQSKLSRHWECPKSKAVIQIMRTFMNLRWAAVSSAVEAVHGALADDAFSGDVSMTPPRLEAVQTLERVLKKEADMLQSITAGLSC